MAATPAQAAFGCDQRNIPNGWYNKCWGVAGDHHYQTQITCRRANAPLQRYIVKGEWRRYGGKYASVATCPGADFPSGDRQLNFN